MSDDKNICVENVRTAYREVCQNHRAITDFRAKLLTFLPLASGTGIFLLLKQKEPSTHLAAIGIFGFVVTLGLFFHELRGILQCGDLIQLGKELERKLGLDEGQFTSDYEYYNPGRSKVFRRIFHEIIGPVGAAWIIYPSVCVAWLYVAAFGLGIPIARFLAMLSVLFIAASLWGAIQLWKLLDDREGKPKGQ